MDKNLKPLVSAIQSGKKITFFLGAGISTSAGIPDFRTPGTGLYSNLAKFNLPFPEAVFDIDYFREHPTAFYILADELYPGKFKPTLFHFFVKLLENKNLLHRVYTQNIDTLERIAGVNDNLIVEVHGSFAKNHCIDCEKEMSTSELKAQMKKVSENEKVGIPKCLHCKGYVKPDITFFGEGLPQRFFELWEEDSDDVEVAVVAGTSLSVYPFASLPAEVSKKALRVLINQESVGDFKASRRKTDVLALDDCDTIAKEIVKLLGWESELEELSIKAEEKEEDEKEEEKEEEVKEKEAKEEDEKYDSGTKQKESTDDLSKDISKLTI